MLPWAHSNPHTQRHLHCLSRFYTAHGWKYGTVLYAFPLKIVHPHGGSGPHLIYGSLGNQVHIPNSMSIGSAVIVGLTIVTDRLRYFVCSNRLHLHSTTTWPNNKTSVWRLEGLQIHTSWRLYKKETHFHKSKHYLCCNHNNLLTAIVQINLS